MVVCDLFVVLHNWPKCDEASLPVEEEQAASPPSFALHCLLKLLFTEVGQICG